MHYILPHEPEISAVTPLMAHRYEHWSSLSFNSKFFRVLRGIPQIRKFYQLYYDIDEI